MTTTATATSQDLTAEQKDAYNKGWASAANSMIKGGAAFTRKLSNEQAAELLSFFDMGYIDKHNGSAKWDSVKAGQLEAAAKPAKPAGKVVRHEDAAGLAAVLRVADEPVADADLAAEAAAPAEDAVPAAADLEPVKALVEGSIAHLRHEASKKDKPREQVAAIRELVRRKKRHYLAGFAAAEQESTKREDAEAAYLKRHDATFLNDWAAGWEDRAAGVAKGASWNF
jgi:hypothetical protein